MKELIKKILEEEIFDPEKIEAFLTDFAKQLASKNEILQTTLKISDSEMEDLYTEGYKCYHADKLEQAHVIFKILVILNSFVARYWMGLGGTQLLLEQYEKALESYAIASLLDGDSPYPHFHAYECYAHLGNQEEGLKALRAALRQASSHYQFSELRQTIEKELIKWSEKSTVLAAPLL